MNELTSKQFSIAAEDFLSNPARAQQFALGMLERTSNGEYSIVDATNPFTFLLEAATANASANFNQTERLIRKIYPSLAGSYDDLYNHMSDVDYLNRFAVPSRTKLTMLLGLDEVKQKAVVENAAGVRRITVPRFTRFSVADTPFTLLYPIDIRLMRHGGFRITYNDDIVTDVETLETNLIDWDVITINEIQWLAFDIPIKQLDITRVNAIVNRSTGFTKTYQLPDDFHYCEAYNRVGDTWTKIHVTHSELVHNPNQPTVSLKVLNQAVTVTIPQIYLNTRAINDSVRLDFYTTKGKIRLDLAGYDMGAYDARWNPVANEKVDKFSAPLDTFNSVGLYSDSSTTGGSNGIGFQELRERVINRTTTTEGLPITNRQLSTTLSDLGFDLVTNIDDVTNRQFIATRLLPPPLDNQTIAGVGAAVETLISSITTMRFNKHVIANNKRTTIKPTALFKLTDGILQLVTDTEHSGLLNSPDRSITVSQLNDNQYLYTPYYYIIDTDRSTLDTRIYDLDSPTVQSRFFFEHNLTVGAKFDIKAYSIVPAVGADGFFLEVEAEVGEILTKHSAYDLDIQLSFTPVANKNRYHISGTLLSEIGDDNLVVGKRYIWRFHIETRYDVNASDQLLLMPFYVPTNLTHEFDITTVVKNYVPTEFQASDLDAIVENSFVDGGEYIALTQEKLTLKFGERLERLYNRTRTVVDPDAIIIREADEPLVYERDVHEYDSTGNIKFEYDSQTNEIAVNKLHNAGEIVYNEFNQPIYKWRKGDIVLDHLGQVTYINGGAGLKRELDLFLLDARYQFANTVSATTYKDRIKRLVNSWVNDDMVKLNNQLLERSEMFFHPTVTKGVIKVKADNNKLISVDTQQTFTITFFMEEEKHSDPILRAAIKESAIRALHDGLQFSTVSKDSLLSRLRSTAGDDIVSVDIEGFLRDEWRTATLVDKAQRLSIDKRMVLKTNGEYEIEDAVDVKFLIHSTK